MKMLCYSIFEYLCSNGRKLMHDITWVVNLPYSITDTIYTAFNLIIYVAVF